MGSFFKMKGMDYGTPFPRKDTGIEHKDKMAEYRRLEAMENKTEAQKAKMEELGKWLDNYWQEDDRN